MAVRAVHRVPAPPVAQPGDAGEFIGQAGRDQQPARADHLAVGQRHGEPITVVLCRADLPGHHLAAVAVHLGPAALQQFGGRHPVAGQQPVYARGRGIARLARVDDQHRTARPGQHQRPAQPRGTAADHHHVIAIP